MQVNSIKSNSLRYLVGLAALLVLGGCSSLPSKHVYTEIEIDAPVKKVWGILADIDKYPEWNPYHVKVEGKLALGERLDVVLHKPNGEVIEIEPHVMRLEPLRELTWGGGIKGIFHGEHVFLLNPTAAGGTHLVQKEDFTGIVIPFASLDAVDEGYELMNAALKKRAEMK